MGKNAAGYLWKTFLLPGDFYHNWAAPAMASAQSSKKQGGNGCRPASGPIGGQHAIFPR
jgi:hypothetical protein